MAQADAVFSEVLQLEVDTAAFTTGLAQLESAYTEFLARIQTAGEGTNLGGVAAASLIQLNTQVAELGTALQNFAASVDASFEVVDSDLRKMQAGIEATGQAAVEAQSKLAQEKANAAAGSGRGGVGVGNVSSFLGGAGDFFSGISRSVATMNGGLLGMLGYMAALRAAWTLVGGAINVVAEIIRSPFEVLKTGFAYLTQLQDQAASMQGSIAANAAYSKDLGANFQKAGDAAHQVAVSMQELGVKMGVPAVQLEHIFTDVLESGGLHFTKSMQGVVDLTEMFALAMQKTSTDVETQRRIMMEIPKLLDGQNSSGSRILTTLGLTNEQWQKMRLEAIAHGDLVEKLSSLMAPYLTVVEQANIRQHNLIDGLKLQASQIAGAIALPLWGRFTGVLQTASDFLKGNTVSMEAFGKSIVGVGEDIGALLGKIFEIVRNSTTLKLIFEGIGQVIVVSVFAVRSLLDIITLGVSQLAQLMNFMNSPEKWFNKDSWKEAFAQIQKEGQDAFNKIQDAAVDAGTALFVKGGVAPDTSLLNKPVTPKKDLPDPNAEKAAARAREDAFRATQESFRSELEKTKQKFSETDADIKAKQETGAISTHEATLQRVIAIHTELDEIQKLVQAYTVLAAKSGVKPTEIQKFDATLTDVNNAAQSKATVQTTSVLAADQQSDERITQAHEERLRQMAIAHSRNMIQIYREEAKDGLITKSELFDREAALAKQEQEAVLSALSAELKNAGSNEREISRINDEITAANQKYTDKTVEFSRIRLTAVAQETLQLEHDKRREQELDAQTDQLTARANARGWLAASEVSKANTEIVAKHLEAANAALADAEALEKYAVALGITGTALEKYKLQVAEAAKNQAQAFEESRQADLNSPNGQESQKIFGTGIASIHEAFTGFGTSVASLNNAMHFFGDAAGTLISAIRSGFSSGGVAGAIGGGAGVVGGFMSSLKGISGVASSIPIAGAIISGVGEIFSIFGSIFTSHAKKVAADIQKSVSDLMNQYSNGQTTLVATISSLEQQRANAIAELSGQKGGQDQLNKLLPQIDQQLAQLKQQQVQVKATFEQSLAVLQTHSQTIGQILTTWQQINKQVKDYLDAGGDAAKAAQFLSLSLQQQLQTTADSLLSAEDSAIQDAMKLNDLLTQRVNMAKQFAEQEFSLRNQDALERMANPAVNAALSFQAQKAANDAQLTALDQQISLYTSRVAMEKQVFNIASDTAALQSQANQLNLSALAQTIQGWQDLQKIIASITQNSAGLFSLNPNLFNAPAAGTTNSKTINVGTVNVVTAATDAPGIAAALAKELSLVGQFGANTSYA